MSSKTIDQTGEFVRMTARHQGWRVVENEEFLVRLIAGLTKNYNRFGYYQCPCRESWDGDRDKDWDIVCPCEYCQADIDTYGQCLCGLFLSPEFAESGKRVRQIPERREAGRFP